MSHFRFFACALVFAALAGGLPAADSGPSPSSTGIAVDVTVKPLDRARTQFLCRIDLTELPSDRLISGMHLQLVAGRSATASSLTKSGTEVTVQARVEEGGAAASYSVEYRRGAVLVASQKGSIALSPAGP